MSTASPQRQPDQQSQSGLHMQSSVQPGLPVPRLEIRHIYRYFDGRAVVDDVSLQIQAGQVTCLLGPSGCGKSTTLRMIAGVEMQDSGEIYVDGKLICDTVFRVPPERREIGLMFQDFALFPHLSVADNVAFGLNKGSKAEKRARVEELLEKVSLKRFIDDFPHQLSGGEQQRVALARALAPKPRIMLMDEPFSGLDNRLRDGIRDETLTLLKEEDAAVLLVTHEPEEAMRMADEIALMRGGKIVQQGAPYNVYTRPIDKAAVAFFSDINVLKSQVNGALADTPFGQFLAPGIADRTDVEIVFRPQHVRIDFDRSGKGPLPTATDGVPARAVVKRARYLGHESLVEFQMDYDDSILKVTVPRVFLPEVGRVMWLTVPRNRCFVFPA
ncbi:Fe(3+) ions import ATP-binding protein FbpC 2 [Phaeobacter sp. CECT 5382]|nr:Fe(3+) ions import ATP-binding protein FbpC 2 [Phaeobacter sp. CECT 5382]